MKKETRKAMTVKLSDEEKQALDTIGERFYFIAKGENRTKVIRLLIEEKKREMETV